MNISTRCTGLRPHITLVRQQTDGQNEHHLASWWPVMVLHKDSYNILGTAPRQRT